VARWEEVFFLRPVFTTRLSFVLESNPPLGGPQMDRYSSRNANVPAGTETSTRLTSVPTDSAVKIVTPIAQEKTAVVASARYVLLHLACVLTGYTVKAMQRKIERGDWTEGKVWKRAPDGRVLIDMVEYHKWVEGR
jgi:hypothetical protein